MAYTVQGWQGIQERWTDLERDIAQREEAIALAQHESLHHGMTRVVNERGAEMWASSHDLEVD